MRKSKIILIQVSEFEGVKSTPTIGYKVKKLINRREPLIGTLLSTKQLQDLSMSERELSYEIIGDNDHGT